MSDQEQKTSAEERAERARARKARSRMRQESRAEMKRNAFEGIRKGFSPVTNTWGKFRGWLDDNRKWAYPLLLLLTLAVALYLPFIPEHFPDAPDIIKRATGSGILTSWAVFTLFALGLNIVVGFAGLLDLGYVAFWALGSYTAATLTGAQGYSEALQKGAKFGEVAEPTWELWMWGIFVAAIVVSVLAGIILGSPTLRLRGDYLAIVTLGFGEIVRIAANNNILGITNGPRGVNSIPHPKLDLGPINLEWGVLTDKKYYFLALVFVILWILAIRALDHSRIGRAWVAIREDEIAAATMGVPTVQMKLAAFAIGASTAGVGGVLYASQVNFVNPPTFDLLGSILILSAVVIGGMGSIPGSILGAFAIFVLPEIFRGFEEYRYVIFGLVLVIVMIFRPQGLLPSKRRKAELKGGTRDAALFEVQHTGE